MVRICETTVSRWVREHVGQLEHEMRVAEIARKLFLLSRRRHNLGHGELRVLTLGALIHDVGRSIADEGHARIGARMILEDDELPLTGSERRRLACLTRHHRGRVPEPGEECHLDPRQDNARATRILLGLLRAADALDSRSLPPPTLVITLRERVLSMRIHTECDVGTAQEKLARPKKLRLLGEVLRCDVRTHWFGATEYAAVLR